MTARSRTRTRYGSQREIEAVAAALEPGEVLLHLAVTRGPSTLGRAQHGLLALTDQRLRFEPRPSSPAQPHEVALTDVSLLTWTPDADGGTGTLSVLGDGVQRVYAGVGRADGRDLVAGIRTVRPAVRLAEPPV